MIYANKKVAGKPKLAEQTSLIIANVKELQHKELIRLENDTVYLQSQLWKNKLDALNWINCLHHYYCLNKKLKSSQALYFRDIGTRELIGNVINRKPKVFIFIVAL